MGWGLDDVCNFLQLYCVSRSGTVGVSVVLLRTFLHSPCSSHWQTPGISAHILPAANARLSTSQTGITKAANPISLLAGLPSPHLPLHLRPAPAQPPSHSAPSNTCPPTPCPRPPLRSTQRPLLSEELTCPLGGSSPCPSLMRGHHVCLKHGRGGLAGAGLRPKLCPLSEAF